MDYRSSSGVPATRCFSTGMSGFGLEQALEASPRSALTAALSRSSSASACSAQEPDAGQSRHAAGFLCCMWSACSAFGVQVGDCSADRRALEQSICPKGC